MKQTHLFEYFRYIHLIKYLNNLNLTKLLLFRNTTVLLWRVVEPSQENYIIVLKLIETHRSLKPGNIFPETVLIWSEWLEK